MPIKNLVLSGGSWKGLYMTGSIGELLNKKYIVKEEIESIWATSVGTLLGVLFCLKIEWDDIIDYFINLPLNSYNNFNIDFCLKAIEGCGLLDQKFFILLLNSLFNSEQLNINEITLGEFYKYSNKEIHFFTVNYNTTETRDLNYKTDPTLKLIDAIYCSCTFPFLFKPKKIDDVIYLDGGINVHFPVDYCLKEKKDEETIGIYIKSLKKENNNLSNMLEFGLSLIYKIIFSRQNTLGKLKNELIITCESAGIGGIFEMIKNKELRKKKIDEGKDCSTIFLKNLDNRI